MLQGLTLAAIILTAPAIAPNLGAAQPSSIQPPARFTAPFQPWASPDGQVHLLRPAMAKVVAPDAPLGALTSAGWRMIWDGSPVTPGRSTVRVVLKVSPPSPGKTATEGLQVGVSYARSDVRTCLTYGLEGSSAHRLPERIINGRRYVAWSNADAGMSQQVSATNLRAVVEGACYAVDRFRYAESASDGDPSVTLTEAAGATLMDRALASVQLGALSPGRTIRPPLLELPPGAVAR